jgi:hypothetical protein
MTVAGRRATLLQAELPTPLQTRSTGTVLDRL